MRVKVRCSGTLLHVILRGIERRKIVDDDKDRENFVTRMSTNEYSGLENKDIHLEIVDGLIEIISRRPSTEQTKKKSRDPIRGSGISDDAA